MVNITWLWATVAAGTLWLLNPPQWTFHYYLIHFLREQAHNRKLLEERRVNLVQAINMAQSTFPVTIKDEDILNLVVKLRPRIWNFYFFQLARVEIRKIRFTFVGFLSTWKFFVADSDEPLNEFVLVTPEKISDAQLQVLSGVMDKRAHWSEDMDPDLKSVFDEAYRNEYDKDHPGELPSWMNPHKLRWQI